MVPRVLVLFSAVRGGGEVRAWLPPASGEVLLELPADILREDAVLLIELGAAGQADPELLAQVVRLAAAQHDDVRRRWAAIGLVGDVSVLQDPGTIVGLRADAVWSLWPDQGTADRALAALLQRAARRSAWIERLRHYQSLCESLSIGAFLATRDGQSFLWADDHVEAILGIRSGGEVEAPQSSSPQAVIEDWPALLRALESSPYRIASLASHRVGREGRLRLLLAETRTLDGAPVLGGFVHDFERLRDMQEEAIHQRLAELLDDLGFAYFAARLDGTPTALSRRDRELLGNPPEAVHWSNRAEWWKSATDREEWVANVISRGVWSNQPVRLRTYQGNSRWVDADARALRNDAGEVIGVEGIYRDATRRRFEERLARSLQKVGASDAGFARTAIIVCESAAELFEATACAMMLQDDAGKHVFPARAWVREGDWTPPGASDPNEALLFQTGSLPPEVVRLQARPFIVRGDHAGRLSASVFAEHGLRGVQRLLVLPLLRGDAEETDDGSSIGGLWIPLVDDLSFGSDEFEAEIEAFVRLCTRQLDLAANRDAWALVHEVMTPSAVDPPIAPGMQTFAQLRSIFERVRRELQQRLPMEGCSFFHVGVEDQHETLLLGSSSGLLKGDTRYHFGEGLTGTVASTRTPRIAFHPTRIPEFAGKSCEVTEHPLQTWMGVPMLDRDGRCIGVIRCANRVIGARAPRVTGFSALDLKILTELGAACAMQVELHRMREVQGRMLARIVHEIRTPVVGMRNNVQFLNRRLPGKDAKIAAKLADLDLDAAVLLNLLHQVDVLQAMRRGPSPESLTATNVPQIVRKTLYQLVPELKARGFDLKKVYVDLHLPELMLPQASFVQVVFNLFWNAVKYSHVDPSVFHVVVQSVASEEAYELHFKDWGIGVAASDAPRIFLEGFRSMAARAHDARGLGLGLAVSKRIVEKFGGTLTLRSLRTPTDLVVSIPRSLAVQTGVPQ
jgi:signal transduction histidine kinase/PAS domain-containing protein